MSLPMHMCHFYLHRGQNLCTYVTKKLLKFDVKVGGIWVDEHRSNMLLNVFQHL